MLAVSEERQQGSVTYHVGVVLEGEPGSPTWTCEPLEHRHESPEQAVSCAEGHAQWLAQTRDQERLRRQALRRLQRD